MNSIECTRCGKSMGDLSPNGYVPEPPEPLCVACREGRGKDCTVSYFAGALLALFMRESTCLPLRVTDVRTDPPDGFFLELSDGNTLRISVAKLVRRPAAAPIS